MNRLPSDAPLEQSLNYAAELLQCAIATIYEGGDRLRGTDRQLVLSGMHLVKKATDVIEHAMTSLETP